MSYLIGQILICLLIAFILGFIVGFLFRHFMAKAREAALNKEVTHAQGETQAALVERDGARQELSEVHGELSSLKTAHQVSVASLETAHEANADATARLTALQGELETARGKMRQAEAQASSSATRVSSLTTQLQTAEDNASGHAASLIDMRGKLAAATAAAAAAAAASAAVSSDSSEELDDLKRSHATLQSDHEGLQSRYSALLAEHEAQKAAAPAVVAAAGAGALAQPWLLAAPVGGAADDLKRVKGIGPVMEKTLNKLGIYHFHQLKKLGPDEVKWVADHIDTFSDRIERDRWVEQAAELDESDE